MDVVIQKTAVSLANRDRHDGLQRAGTTIVCDIPATANGSEVHFDHDGLVPSIECFDGWSQGWSYYLFQRLRPLIEG